MALKGKSKEISGENKNYTKYVGMFNGKVVAVNPTKEQLGKLLNTTIEKDLEYTSINEENGAKKLILSFWLREESTGQHFNVRFNLEDTVKVSKSGKTQFINSIGSTSYAEDESSVPSFITQNGRSIRKAKVGEELLYNFLRNWLSNLNYDDESTELMLNWKQLISGKTQELNEAIQNFDNQLICAMAIIRTDSTTGKEYQGVYSYAFLPSYALDCFNGKKNYKTVDKFIEKVEDSNYGCQDYYQLKPMCEYDPTKNVVASTDAPIISTDPVVDDLPF
jgi:hypothetical protein